MKANNIRKVTSVTTVVAMLFSFFWPWIGLIPSANAALATTWPVSPFTTFPNWFQDAWGLPLELMEAADGKGISAAVVAWNELSEQIGFWWEWFWFSADATMPTAAWDASIVQAVEASFAPQPNPTDWLQSAFTRIRIRIDVPNIWEYTVTYPYWERTYDVTDPEDLIINDTTDVWCFSQPGVSLCDTVAEYDAVLAGEIWPFVTWETFELNPLDTDPLLIDGITWKRYIGIAWEERPIKNGPNWNIFRVDGPNIGWPWINSIETDLFEVTWRIATIDSTPPAIGATSPASAQVLSENVWLTINASDDLWVRKVTMDVWSLGNTLKTTINWSQVVPSSASPATWSWTFTINTVTNTLTYDISTSWLSWVQTEASLRWPAATWANWAVIASLPLTSSKSWILTYPQNVEADIINWNTYISISTWWFPNWEVRWQVLPQSDLKTLVRNSWTATAWTWFLEIAALDRVWTFSLPISITDWSNSTSWTFELTVSPPPAPVITTQNLTTSWSALTISWTWVANSTIELFSWSTVIASWTVNGAWIFSFAWVSLTEWTNVFQASIKDVAWNPSDLSNTLTVIMDTVAPDAPVITDVSWTLVNTPTITVNWTAEADSTVSIKKWSLTIATWTADWSWAFSVAWVPLAQWLNTLSATSTDLAWNTSGPSGNLTVTLDSVAPAWTVTFPAWSVTKNQTEQVNLTISETWSFSASWAWVVWTLTWDIVSSTWITVTLAIWDWLKNLDVLFSDLAWNSSVVSASITLDTTAPAAPTITSDNLTTSWTTVTITWTWEANATVDILDWTWSIIASWSVDPQWAFSVSGVPVVAWLNSIQARLTDAAWNVSDNSTQPVSVVVDRDAPDAAVISSTPNLTSSSTTTIVWTWEANIAVTVFRSSVAVWNWTVDWSWALTITWVSLAEWSNAFTVKLTDAAWNISASSNSVTVTRDSLAPTVTNLQTLNITHQLADISFNFTDSNFTIWTWTWAVSYGTWWSLSNAWTSNVAFTAWTPNSGLSSLAWMLPSTTYGFSLSLIDNAGNTATSTGSFATASSPISLSGWSVAETWSTNVAGATIPSWGSLQLNWTNILISSNPADPNSITGSLSLSWITSLSIEWGNWNWIILAPTLVSSWTAWEASAWEISWLISSSFWSWAVWSVLQTVKVWWESWVSILANWWLFTLSISVPSSNSWQVLSLIRSTDGTTWQLNTPDNSCTVDSNKMCTFNTDHLSFFASLDLVDTIPNTLSFASLTWRGLNAVETSETLTATWTNTWASVTVANWLISINSGALSTTWTINNWDTVKLQLTNSPANSTTVTATISVWTTQVWSFSSTTLATTVSSGGGGGGGWGGGWLFVDTCTNWDKSWNSYDWKCDALTNSSSDSSSGASSSWNGSVTTNSGSTSVTGWKSRFSDIDDSFAKDDILEFVEKWILKWYEDWTFRPNSPITRAEFLAIVMKALDVKLDESLTKTNFKDIPEVWMIKYIEKAWDYWIKGQTINGELRFRPNDPISRAEAMAILLNIAWIAPSEMTDSSFSDIPATWMISYLEKVKELGIAWWQVISWTLKFRPNDSLSRAEATRVLKKTLGVKNMKTYTIEITSSWVSPQTITINKWDKVNFINKDSAPHWPASWMHPVHTGYPGSDIKKCWTPEQSKIFDACKWLAKDEAFTFIFNEVWEWGFHDHLDVSVAALRWKIIVK
ncbi:MAG: hypothetical protein ACD_2C00186G0003 [uncultured bacterium (gcode 4)]|uniref:SLH domain-containing protein n=1 Tax=uncultured bacterium (gcode 4) TaxID=1234023 RepID=K2G2B4_9BACT|nr:MAG: hypothetical protein ACD_2C00186G0003 [uncultured bacterium (gcode 4)]